MNQLIRALKWRYATKQFDPAQKLTSDQVDYLLESVNLTPTSYGLQLFTVINVVDPELRRQIQAASFGQSQVTQASHLFILAAKKTLIQADIDAYLAQISTVRGTPLEKLANFRQMLQNLLTSRTPEALLDWNKKQTFIALGFLLAAAAFEHLDACPMEGFNQSQVNQILKLDDLNLTATLLCPVGFRSSSDESALRPKVRKNISDLVLTL